MYINDGVADVVSLPGGKMEAGLFMAISQTTHARSVGIPILVLTLADEGGDNGTTGA